MSERVPMITREDRGLFDLHPEAEMTESLYHARQIDYFKSALAAAFPDLFIARDMGVYWVRGQRSRPYVGPDIFVSRHPPALDNPHVYLTYEDGPIAFVIEVASEKTRRKEAKKRDEIYAAALRIPEYLFVDQERDRLELWRLVEGAYERIEPDAQERLWSEELDIGFAWQEDGRLVRVLTTDGVAVPTDQEARALQREAETRVEQEAQRRIEAEARAAALEAEIERLRRAHPDQGESC